MARFRIPKPRIPRFRINLQDPKARVRLLLYLGALLVAVLLFLPAAMQLASTPTFCKLACHEMKPYVATWSQSSHSQVTCYACHGGGAPNVITLMMKKMSAMKELYMHALSTYEKPINGESLLSEEMDAGPCNLCHDILNRKITTSPGIIINHKKHLDKGIGCARCHNRVAHGDPQGYETGEGKTEARAGVAYAEETTASPAGAAATSTPPPATGTAPSTTVEKGAAPPPDVNVGLNEAASGLTEEEVVELEGPDALKEPYPNRMMMRYCFDGCHSQVHSKAKAEGQAGELEQASAEAGQAEGQPSGEGEGEGKLEIEAPGRCNACHTKEFKLTPANHDDPEWLRKKAPAPKAMHPRLFRKDKEYCQMCHDLKTFCSGCHGVEMPHAEDFKQIHGRLGKRIPEKCRLCHTKPNFCDACHHKEAKAGIPWVKQHFKPVKAQGAQPCFACHGEVYCSHCHVTGKKYSSIKGP